MATRKLKFKPKPLVSGTIRRARDKDDLQELTTKELNISKLESSSLNANCIATSPAVCESENLVVGKGDCINTRPNDNPVKKFKTEQGPPDSALLNNLKVYNDHAAFDCSLRARHHNDSLISSTINPTKEDKSTPSHITNEEFTPSYEHKEPVLNLFRPNCIVSNLTESKLNSENENIQDVLSSPTKVSTGDKFSNEMNSVNTSPQILHTEFKPVLNDPGLRKKNDDTITSDSVFNIAGVRTDSVIKSVQLELNKGNSIVKEITDSFTALESEEPTTSNVDDLSNKEQMGTNHNKTKLIIKSNDFSSSSSANSSLTKQTLPSELHSSKNKSTIGKLCKTVDSSNCVSDKIELLYEYNVDGVNKNIPSNLSNKVPMSPLRTTSKILVPKPSPRLSDIGPRRISFQGSDSEDEAKRKNANIKSEIPNPSINDKYEKDIKNNKRKRSQGSTYSKMGQDTLEKFTKKFGKDETPDKTKLTMIDLIFYNPKSNPMTLMPQQVPIIRKKEEKLEVSETVEETLAEQNVDDVEPALVPVPQLKVGPDGQVMLDPQSLIIEMTGIEKSRAKLEKSQVIQDTGITRYSTYCKRKPKRCDWSSTETLQFYRALNTIGSDFALMTKLFPKRTRHELKLKFKREEKINMHLIDKAMTTPTDFDYITLQEELKLENEEIQRKLLQKKLDAADVKKQRALKREENIKCKNQKGRKPKDGIKKKHSAFKDFNETDKGKQHLPKERPKRRTIRKRNLQIKESELIDSDLEEELHIDLDSDSMDDDDGLAIIQMVQETRTGRLSKPTTKLAEYEEINETLKKKLNHESDSEEDLYTPNGPGAHMLFGSPHETPAHELEERPWNIEIQSLPNIEDTVLLNNVEEVSELSELGSFGQNDTALDLSMPIRSNIQRELLNEKEADSSLLNRHIISQSIKIIDQLTSNVDGGSMDAEEEVMKGNMSEEQIDNKVPLPSFESVSRSRPSMMYPLQTPFIPMDCSDSNETLGSSEAPKLVVAEYYSDNEECILGE